MGVASTVSRLPITVKVVPMSSNEEEGGGEQQQGEADEEGSQQHNSQTQAEEEAAQTGEICLILCAKSRCSFCSSDVTKCNTTTSFELLDYRSSG